jgi:hypothetical protein
LTATFDSPDQYVAGMPVDTIELQVGMSFPVNFKKSAPVKK